MMKYKIIALIGPAGSGKDSLLEHIVNNHSGLHKIVGCTTRPPREGEIDGIHYHFLSAEEFALKVLNFDIIEATTFREWGYGTSIQHLSTDKINIGVFNPASLEILSTYDNIDLYIYYINAPEKTRLIRQLNREENPDIDEIFRRLKADREDFFDIEFNEILDNVYPLDLIKNTQKILEKANTF